VEAVINKESQYVRTTDVLGDQLTADPATDLFVSIVQSRSYAYPYLKFSTSTKPVTSAFETSSTKHSQNNSDVTLLWSM